jgi:Tannase and feruloyl esterase
LKLPKTIVLSAEQSPAGTFMAPGTRPERVSLYQRLPAFCRVVASVETAPQNQLQIEVWMPANNWNGRYLGRGNGGFAGSVSYDQMAGAIEHRYATAGTDTGHSGRATDASWALHHPEKIADFGYRAIHQMTETAKAVIAAFYGQPEKHAYFESCSDGGREALMEAQRFPADYEGIIAGAPANSWTRMLAAGIEVNERVLASPANVVPPSKIPAISEAVLAACDSLDGLKDGIVNDPTKCRFDPQTLLCKGTESDACLTAPEIATLKRIYSGQRDANGQTEFPGLLPGAETGRGGWDGWVLNANPGQSEGFRYLNGFFRDMVYNDPAWTSRNQTFSSALAKADATVGSSLNAVDPNLRPFAQHGGKLILYHGWNDPAIPALNSVNYFNSVVKTLGAAATDKFVRLYMVPGMQHCVGGPGATYFGQFGLATEGGWKDGIISILEQWVENGTAPAAITATKYVDDTPAKGVQMTRPLCPYPESVKYNGSGDPNRAASFSCSK